VQKLLLSSWNQGNWNVIVRGEGGLQSFFALLVALPGIMLELMF